MLSWLNFGAKWALVLPAIGVAWVLLFGQPVTELPYGLQAPLETFANGIATAVDILPMMEVLFDILIMGIQIKVVLLLVDVFKWVLSLVLNN